MAALLENGISGIAGHSFSTDSKYSEGQTILIPWDVNLWLLLLYFGIIVPWYVHLWLLLLYFGIFIPWYVHLWLLLLYFGIIIPWYVHYKMDLQQIRHLFILHDSRVAKDIVRRVDRSKDKVNGSCPTVICEYNQYMGGVDLSDHMKFSCQIGRRRTFRFTREPFSIFWILV